MGSLWSAIGPIGPSVRDRALAAAKASASTPAEKAVAAAKEAAAKAAGTASKAKGTETTDQTSSTVPDSTSAPAGCPTSVNLSNETENRLITSIMTQLKDQRLMDRSVDLPHDSSYSMQSQEDYDYPSDSAMQGYEWRNNRPDMSKYIRKDSIPCWNCSP
jgi:hypothetical protein